MKIAILDDTYDVVRDLPCYSRLHAHEVTVLNDHVTDASALAARLVGVEVLMLMRERTAIDAALLDQLPALRLITLNGVTPHIDLAACSRRGIAVTTRHYVSSATAELTWALVLMASRRIPQEMESLRRGQWQSAGMATGLSGRALGVWGYGQIGRQVAQFGRAFGMTVRVWSRPAGLARAETDGFQAADGKAALFEQSDVVSLHVRLAPETVGCVGPTDLARMKPDALLVNTSRARLIEPGALVAALRQGRPGAAAVDVYEDEPMRDPAHPLLQMKNVICTPHLGYVERQQYEGMYSDQIDRMEAYFAQRAEGVVNPDAMHAA